MLVLDAISPAMEGVGVNGGGLIGEASLGAVLRRLVVGVMGVTKTFASELAMTIFVSEALLESPLAVMIGLSSVAASAVLEGRPRFLVVDGRVAVCFSAFFARRGFKAFAFVSDLAGLMGPWLACSRADLLEPDMVANAKARRGEWLGADKEGT